MYSVPHPVSAIRSRIRQEFERHRFVNKLPVVDVLLMQSNADYQVSHFVDGRLGYGELRSGPGSAELAEQIGLTTRPLQETMNFWRQTNHIMSFFKEENFRGEKRLPSNFITGFLEVSTASPPDLDLALTRPCRVGIRARHYGFLYVYIAAIATKVKKKDCPQSSASHP